MTSELKVDKITPASGTNTQIGEAGDTTNLSAGTVTLPTTIITGQTEKTTLVDADKFLISDSAASGAFKYVQTSNLPSLDNTPSFRVRTSSVQTFSSGYQKVQYDAEEWDTDGVFDHTTNYRFTVPSGQAGKYHITIYHRQNGTSSQALNYGIVLYKNGSGYRYHNANPSYGGNVSRYGVVYTEDIALAVNDYLEVYINGGGFELGAGSGLFMAYKLIGV